MFEAPSMNVLVYRQEHKPLKIVCMIMGPLALAATGAGAFVAMDGDMFLGGGLMLFSPVALLLPVLLVFLGTDRRIILDRARREVLVYRNRFQRNPVRTLQLARYERLWIRPVRVRHGYQYRITLGGPHGDDEICFVLQQDLARAEVNRIAGLLGLRTDTVINLPGQSSSRGSLPGR